MKEQTYLPGTEPPGYDRLDSEISAAIEHALELDEEAKTAASRRRAARDAVLILMTEKGFGSHPYVDAGGKHKRWVCDTTPRCKSVPAPKPKKRKDDTVSNMKPETVESRRVPRTAEHDAVIDPFATTRKGLLDEAAERSRR